MRSPCIRIDHCHPILFKSQVKTIRSVATMAKRSVASIGIFISMFLVVAITCFQEERSIYLVLLEGDALAFHEGSRDQDSSTIHPNTNRLIYIVTKLAYFYSIWHFNLRIQSLPPHPLTHNLFFCFAYSSYTQSKRFFMLSFNINCLTLIIIIL